MGDKYIIELEDKPFHKEYGDFLYRVKGFNSLVFDMTGISKLTPYTEPDLELIKNKAHDNGYSEGYQDGYSKGMNDYLQNPEVKEESEESKKEQSVTDEESMRKYLDEFCNNTKSCTVCPLHISDFTCGRGYHFMTENPVSDEEVRRAYAKVVKER